ncbi:ATP-binding cassette domain-containing protein [Agarivorans aestuarii]|uniref:ATP-binding cassette domain-containing protein n=1 Tax=Agarivorans aestuarii TaxID=1563703 RepID=A0ABU7G5U7_9ALTE|nr:ATP-binding cassette domain-containing protein [Agarivorans aestuarii]MEE1674788.1 ATP-binding cassette domain-containing protein [Agarivorans aestuarii]
MEQQNPDLKPTLISLLQQLGLYSQATNIEQDQRLDSIDVMDFVGLLKKHHIAYSVHRHLPSLVSQAAHPFVLISDHHAPKLLRRHGEQLEQFEQQWQACDPATIGEDAHLIMIERLPQQGSSAKAFAEQVSKRSKWYRPVFWLSLLSSLTGLAVPLFTMAVYDRVIGGQTPEVLPSIALGAALALSILVASRLIRAKVMSSASNRMARDLSELTFHRLLNMPLMVLSRVGIANHVARMRNAEKVRTVLSGPAAGGLIDLPFTFIALATITLLSGWLVLVPLLMLLVFYLLMRLMRSYIQSASPTVSGEYQNALNELAKNLTQLKAAGQVDAWTTKFARLCRENSRQNFRYATRNGLMAAVAHALSLSTALVTVFCGIFLVLNQSISAGALIACVMLIWRITGPAQLAFSSTQKFTLLKGAAEQFDRFMQVKTENSELRLDVPDMSQVPSVSFQHLTLRYGAEMEPALSAVNAEIDAGEMVAVIGPNGCGKTSLLLSALGVIEPQAGYVAINNKNIRQYDPELLRSWAAYCPAEPDLFPGTLAENLRVANPDASDEQLVDALLAAGGRALFSALNEQLDAPIAGDDSAMLSAVEGGYISLARALLKGSQYLLLDEPLANRNPDAKRQFIRTLESLRGKATIIFTSHDQELIQLADKVIILDKGTAAYVGPIPSQQPQSNSETEQ